MIRVFLVLVLVLLQASSAFAQTDTPTPEPSATPGLTPTPVPTVAGCAEYTACATVPIIWGGAMPIVYIVWVIMIVYGLYRFILGLIPSS